MHRRVLLQNGAPTKDWPGAGGPRGGENRASLTCVVFAFQIRFRKITPVKSRLRQLDAKRYKRVDSERLDDYAKRPKIG